MGDGIQSLPKVNINKHPHSSLICPDTFSIMEGYQTDIAELILETDLAATLYDVARYGDLK